MRDRLGNRKSSLDGDWFVAGVVLTTIQILLIIIYYNENDFDLFNIEPKTSEKRVHLVDHEKPAGETYDYSGKYRIFRHFKSHHWSTDSNEITLITWSTLETLPFLTNLTLAWEGLVSCSVFVNFSEASIVAGLLEKYINCHNSIAKQVSFHLVYEADTHLESFELAGWEAMSCKKLEHELHNFRTDSVIPTALLWNIARSSSTSSYFLFGETNLSPSSKMKSHLEEIVQNITETDIILIPSFAWHGSETLLPSEKLRKLYQDHEISPYPYSLANKFDTAVIDQWIVSEKLQSVQWNMNWNPSFFVSRAAPLFDERFMSVSHDRAHFLCELQMMGYTFLTSPDLFLIGPSMAHTLERNDDPNLRLQNWFLFNYQFKDEVRNKHNSKHVCISDTSDQVLPNLDSRFGQMTNEFVRYDIQRNSMGSPVKVDGPTAYSISGEVKQETRHTQKKDQKKAAVKRMTLEEAMRNQALKDQAAKVNDKLSFEDQS